MREMLKGLVDGGIYPVLSMGLFIVAFVLVTIRALLMKKSDSEYYASLPLDSKEQEG